jgi:hypothetical protein
MKLAVLTFILSPWLCLVATLVWAATLQPRVEAPARQIIPACYRLSTPRPRRRFTPRRALVGALCISEPNP